MGLCKCILLASLVSRVAIDERAVVLQYDLSAYFTEVNSTILVKITTMCDTVNYRVIRPLA